MRRWKLQNSVLIFVLYEREEFLENLAKARAFWPNMVAVDNSPSRIQLARAPM